MASFDELVLRSWPMCRKGGMESIPARLKMRRHYGWCNLAILCSLLSYSVQAADPAPLATRFTSTDQNDRPAVFLNWPDSNASLSGPKKVETATPAGQTKPATPTFAERMQSTRQFWQQQQQADENRPKPTTWQLQNPANPTDTYCYWSHRH